jgi:hypothetical protein
MHPSRGPQISFGSTFPNLVLGTNIHFDLTNCQYEQVEVRDQLFIYDFCVKYMLKEEAEKAEEHDEGTSAERYSEKELETVGWLVSIDGEFKEHPFGFLRPVRNQVQQPLPTREFVEQAVKDFSLDSIALPYHLVLCVMPINFIEFWKLIQNRKVSNQLSIK